VIFEPETGPESLLQAMFEKTAGRRR